MVVESFIQFDFFASWHLIKRSAMLLIILADDVCHYFRAGCFVNKF